MTRLPRPGQFGCAVLRPLHMAGGIARRRRHTGVALVAVVAAMNLGSCSDEQADVARNAATSTTATTATTGAPVQATAGDEPADDPGGEVVAPNFYAPAGWPAIHRDGRNSDTAAVVDPRTDLEAGFHVLDGSIVGAVLTTDATDQLLVTTSGVGGSPCHVFSFDVDTGDQRWCSDAVGPLAVTSSVTVDIDENLYIGDDRKMVSLDREGTERWRTAISGYPLSAQFTPDGRLIFITHIGVAYVLDRADGSIRVEHDLLPEVDFDPATSRPVDCLLGGSESTCYSANTLAIDSESGRFYFTLSKPDDPIASVLAMDYSGGDEPKITHAWENRTLSGGSAASPTISADGTRIYTNDLDDNLVALDAQTGGLIWEFPLGFSPLGSPSVSAEGRIVPSAARGSAVMAIDDLGDRAELAWSSDLFHVGVPVQVVDGPVYAAVADPAATGDAALAVIDSETGEALDIVPAVGSGLITIGTTVGPDGQVFFAGLNSGVFAFR